MLFILFLLFLPSQSLALPVGSAIGKIEIQGSSTYVESTDSNVLLTVISAIQDEKNQQGSWEFPADSNDSRVFYGMVGMAGLGMRFLTSREKLSSVLSSSSTDQLLGFAEEIASELIQKAIVNNATHLIIPIERNSSIVDYGYDFGLAGMASFLATLYNQTQKELYRESSFKLLNAIASSISMNDGVHWQSPLFPSLNNTDWYPYFDYLAVNRTSPTFLGIAFGSGGVAKAALDYLRLTSDSGNTTVLSLLNGSISWILNHKQVNQTEIYFPIVSEVNDVYSSSWASGVTGLVELFSALESFDSSYSLQDEISGMIDWLIGVNDDLPRIGVTWYNASGEIFDQIEYGRRFGVIGTINVLLNLNLTSASVFDALDEELLNLYFIGNEKDGTVLYPERIQDNFLIREGSISYEFGSGGIIETLSNINLTDFPYLDGLAAKVKASLFLSLNDSSLLFVDQEFKTVNFNPMNGIPSMLEYFATEVEGEPYVSSTPLQFGKISFSENKVASVRISNFGDGVLELDLNSSTSDFTVSTSHFIMDEWTSLIIEVTFSPTVEGEIQGMLLIDYLDTVFNKLGRLTVGLSGVGIQPPLINLISPSNMSRVNGTVKFKFSISDDSGVKEASYSLFRQPDTNAIASGSLAKEGDLYVVELDTLKLGNGTYTMTVFAIDFLDTPSELSISFTVENLLSDQGSERTVNVLLWILGTLTVAAAIGAIVFTIRYIRRGNA